MGLEEFIIHYSTLKESREINSKSSRERKHNQEVDV